MKYYKRTLCHTFQVIDKWGNIETKPAYTTEYFKRNKRGYYRFNNESRTWKFYSKCMTDWGNYSTIELTKAEAFLEIL